MSSDVSLTLTDQARGDLLRIQGKRAIASIAKRIDALAVFPQLGLVDDTLPQDPRRWECRITCVAPYGIRYRYDPQGHHVVVDAITDERASSMTRFL